VLRLENEELVRFIENGREERWLEYKQSMSWADDETRLKVVKAALAFANIRDGGTLVFGMTEISTDKYIPDGMQEEHFNSFAQDDVQDRVNTHADPFVSLRVHKIEFNGKKFVVIQFQPFDLLPVVCKQAGKGLFQGNLFTRSQKKHESTIVKSQTEMREILDIAIDNGLKQFHQRLARTGLQINSLENPDIKAFDDELGNL
jgi:predicted HTH transcriptional regulator